MIDEKELLEFIENLPGYGDENFTLADVSRIYDFIEEQPKIGEWIPCSERLPEDGVDVLTWFEYFRYGKYNRLFQTIGISYMYRGKWSGVVNGTSGWTQLRVIAWRPLPEPYKEDN